MKNKGFTLIELSGVFLVLAIILLVAVPPIISSLKKGSNQDYIRFLDTVYVATENYIAEYDVAVDNSVQISIKQLIESGFLKSTIVNPKTDKSLSSTPLMGVKVTISDNGYKYELLDELEKEYTGLSNKEYTHGEKIEYMNKSWYVVKDNGNTVTLILNENIDMGIYGSTTDYNNSTVKQKLESWLNNNFQNEIEKGGIVIDDGSYVRLIKSSELSNKIINDSNTPFWTSDNIDGKIIVALANGIYKYTGSVNLITIYNGSTGSGSNYKESNIYISNTSPISISVLPNSSNLNLEGYFVSNEEYGSKTIETIESRKSYSFCDSSGIKNGYCPSETYLCSYASINDCTKYDIYEKFNVNSSIGYRPVITVNKK